MYNVGQIVYIYKRSSESLFPCVVCEEVIKKSLQGEEIAYRVLLPDDEGTIVDLSKINADIFETVESFNEFYIKSAKDKSAKAIDNCQKIQQQKFHKFSLQRETNEIKKVEEDTNKESTPFLIDEGDTKLRIDMSKLKELGL